MTSLHDAVAWPVRTERLLIRPTTCADLETVWRIRSHGSVSEWLNRLPGELDDYVARAGTDEALAVCLVIELEGRVIGELKVAIGDPWAQAEVAEQAVGVEAELGWVLHPDFEGHGYATEAVRAAIRICFEELGLRRVFAGCFADNEPSWRLMERVGMRREAYTVKEALHRSGEWLDGMDYALLAEEWRAG